MENTEILNRTETMFNEFIKCNDSIKQPKIDRGVALLKNLFIILCTDFSELKNTKNVNFWAVRKYSQNEYAIFCEIK